MSGDFNEFNEFSLSGVPQVFWIDWGKVNDMYSTGFVGTVLETHRDTPSEKNKPRYSLFLKMESR